MTNVDSLTYRIPITALIISQYYFEIQNINSDRTVLHLFRRWCWVFPLFLSVSVCRLFTTNADYSAETSGGEKNRKQNSEYGELLWNVILSRVMNSDLCWNNGKTMIILKLDEI